MSIFKKFFKGFASKVLPVAAAVVPGIGLAGKVAGGLVAGGGSGGGQGGFDPLMGLGQMVIGNWASRKFGPSPTASMDQFTQAMDIARQREEERLRANLAQAGTLNSSELTRGLGDISRGYLTALGQAQMSSGMLQSRMYDQKRSDQFGSAISNILFGRQGQGRPGILSGLFGGSNSRPATSRTFSNMMNPMLSMSSLGASSGFGSGLMGLPSAGFYR